MLTQSDGQAWIEGLKGFLARITLAWERVEPMARRQKAIMVHSA